ncbi:PARP-domain-containing protein [Basidiobolus meristosporus CBS 931.73]|uniref:Poly [ADP-ribose] polymerase n=1 Tax=Basidiobolus meristosporus CBS 931.73 TaxID=1314790 RepID=A0A1Y1XVZ2_9FUNG|nr:PARP-domain-containing protein [Basidiobolus meristosporus CBS 931.73]|eukprot:ORX89903.1 PARP-domain-containing protein [Basidiobolus meristosporus CBS 931.73]
MKTYTAAAVPLLRHNASVDDVDAKTGATIYYRCLFKQNMLFREHRKLLERQHPNVNLIDPITGQTPLEYAIRNNPELVTGLLNLNADPNIKSCINEENLLSDKPVNALVHAVMLNSVEALKILFEHPNGVTTMDLTETDDEHRSILHVIVSPYKSATYDNVEAFKMLQQYLSPEALESLINQKDIYGKSPADYVASQKSSKLYDVLSPYLTQTSETQRQSSSHDTEDMDVDPVHELLPVDVHGDADLQKRKLELEDLKKKEEEAKLLNGGVLPDDWDKKVEIEPQSQLAQVGKVLIDANDEPYDILLNKTDVRRGYHGINMFYKMQLIHNTIQDIYFVWTRWGQIGEEGMHQRTPFQSKEEAENEFKKIFKSKTGNNWENRSIEEFVEKDDRFVVTRNVHNRQVPLKPIDFKKCSPSKLPLSLQATLKLFCDVTSMKQVMLDKDTDIPLGYLDRSVIEEGYQTLCNIREAVNELTAAQNSLDYDYRVVKDMRERLATMSNHYFRKIPYRNEKLRGIQSITTKEILQEETRRLENLRYLNGGANIILAAQYRAEIRSPLDYCYSALGCNWAEVGKGSEEFLRINNYLHQSGRTENYELMNVWSLDKVGQRERFKPFSQNSNRMLLWHGSRFSNYLGILSQGLRVAPVEAPCTGYMFGKGVYFADMFDKSVGYSINDSNATRGYSCLLLCEVALGDMFEATEAKYMESAPDGFLSTKGLGRYGPDFRKALHDNDGLIIPQGPVIERAAKLDSKKRKIEFSLNHNEYIVYNVDQIRLKYIVLVKDHNYCSLCNKEGSEIKHLSELKFGNDHLAGFNSFEQCVANSFLRYNGISMNNLFHERVKDLVIETNAYERSWSPSMPLSYDSKVCSGCGTKLLSMVVSEYLRLNAQKLPTELTSRPDCWYGDKCRTQHNNLAHSVHYNHLCQQTVGGSNPGTS